ncbi:hypothetical protein Salat_1949700 [Sesamum alatum]|uniref:Uncharacterized protein n=1 Tax=Sesamum alatum TaxID=300844 RepID=A0AAE1Y4T8_9LAMI|nr:hypothetical protein Salat_1949700 [Sesamum alatum]
MGALCCCFHVPDVQNNTVLDNSSSDDCLCPKCFFQNFVNKHRSVFTRGQIRAISSSNQQASALNSEMVLNDSPEVSWSHDVAEANAASSRYLQEQCNESNQRQEKVNSKSVQGDRIVVSNCEAGSQRQNCGLESSLDVLSLGVESIFANINPAPDDEDVCPTCFEGVILCLLACLFLSCMFIHYGCSSTCGSMDIASICTKSAYAISQLNPYIS